MNILGDELLKTEYWIFQMMKDSGSIRLEMLDEASLTRQPEEVLRVSWSSFHDLRLMIYSLGILNCSTSTFYFQVFDIVGKLGEGSYGSVFKALHKESKQILAIKQVNFLPNDHANNLQISFFKVPVDTDLQDIIKEISIMQQCDSPYVVKYYGSYFKNTDLWIVMEYCGAGSVSDIMR